MRRTALRAVQGLSRVVQRIWKRCRLARKHKPLILVLTHSPQAKLAVRLAFLQEDWDYVITTCLGDTLKVLEKSRVETVIYDMDSGEAQWHDLCRAVVAGGACFYLIADVPNDDLFLSVIGAGGSGVLWKPVTSEQFVGAMHLARTVADEHLLDHAHHVLPRSLE